MADQKLTSEVEIKGGEKAAEQLKGVADAQKGVTGQVEGAAKGADKATESAKKLSATESDFIGVLTRINPMLGGLVDSLFKSSKIAGDLASANINLTEVFGKLSAAVKVNAATLKLIGAGGAVALAIWAIARAVAGMRAEFDRATKSITASIDAMTELRQEQRDTGQALENLADQRREGGYGSPETARAAAQRVQRVEHRAPYLDQQAILQAVALAGAERSTAELEKIALAIQTQRLQLEPGMAPESRERAIERALNRHADALDKTISRERQQQREMFEEAANQMGAVGGSLDALAKVVALQTRGEGLDSMRLAKALQLFKGALATSDIEVTPREYILERAQKQTGVTLEGGPLAEREYATVERLLPLIQSQAETARLNLDAAKANQRAAELQANRPQTVIHQQFSRHTHPSHRAQEAETKNGWNLARERERF
ncbi:MAG: hypothetical protein WBE26_03455 [Phycisphaerae bacterium]